MMARVWLAAAWGGIEHTDIDIQRNNVHVAKLSRAVINKPQGIFFV